VPRTSKDATKPTARRKREVPIEMSIVIGARAAERDADACLAALEPQIRPGVEVILVEDATSQKQRPDWVRREVRPGGLVPELWATGIAGARGRVLALTAATVVPDPDWVDRMLVAHTNGVAAVGGAIEPGAGMGAVDWAVYFCRYAPYMLPFSGGDAVDVAGDNASYRIDALQPYRGMFADAFWEPFIHAPMRRDGLRLEVRPEIVVRQATGMRFGAFSRQRYAHGRIYGEMRSAGSSRGRVLATAPAAVIVPILMTARVARHVARRGRLRGRFAASLPLVLWFYACWAAGELAGRLRAAGRSS
jgi:hypothetical protein